MQGRLHEPKYHGKLVHLYLVCAIKPGYDGRKTLEVPKMSDEQQADKVIGSHVV